MVKDPVYVLIIGIVHAGTQDADVASFEENVTKALKDGWKCQGGVSMDRGLSIQLMQAMVKD